MQIFTNLYQYRELLKTSVKKEIRGRYKGSILGVLWSFVNPLLQVLVYALVFPYIMKNTVDNYLIYLVTGVIPWTFFTTVVNQGMVTMRNNAGIIKKVYFPREVLPISCAVSGLVNFFISCIIILIFTIFGGVGISWHLVYLPIIAFIQFLFSLGVVFVLSALNVYVKDTEYIVQFFLNLLFYATPIIYIASTLSIGPLMRLIYLNPLTYFIDCYRAIFLYHEPISLAVIGGLFLLSLVVLTLGLMIFRKLERGFAEEI